MTTSPKSTHNRGPAVSVSVCAYVNSTTERPRRLLPYWCHYPSWLTPSERPNTPLRSLAVSGERAMLMQWLGDVPNPLWRRDCCRSSALKRAEHCPSSPCGILGVVVCGGDELSGSGAGEKRSGVTRIFQSRTVTAWWRKRAWGTCCANIRAKVKYKI